MRKDRPVRLEFRLGESLADRAYLIIREQILKGEISLGSPLSRRQLAESLQMSVVPIGEALQRLEREGFVEARHRSGTRVRVPTEEEIRDQYILREALESQAARLVAERATLQQLHELHRMAEQVDVMFSRSYQEQADPQFVFSVHNQHFQFHMRIAESASSEALRNEIETKQVLMFNWLYMVAVPRRKLPLNFHRTLCRALETRNPETADRAMRKHVRYGLEELIAGFQPQESQKWRLNVQDRDRAALL